jgi:hypothetical protein
MKQTVAVSLAAILFLIAFPLASQAQRFSSNDRRAVVLEAFYALRPAHDGGCDKTISGNCISSWNFIDSDTGSYGYLESEYGCASSDWALTSGDPCPNDTGMTVPSFYSNLASYGYSSAGGTGSYEPVGRGGQCTYFANLLVYRAGSYTGTGVFPTLSSMWANTQSNLQTAVEGDVLQVYGDTTPGFGNHVAIVVQIYRTGSTITALDTIDANFLTDTGAANREVIGRHAFCTVTSGCPFSGVLQIQGHYRIWKGTSYYSEPYVP